MLRRITSRQSSFVVAVWLTGMALALQIASPASAVADGQAKAADGTPGTQWVRLLRDDDGKPQAMQTAVVRYVPRNAQRRTLSVDLIGAIHVGDRAYYDQLNRDFEQYDALLYELVAPEGTRITKEDIESNDHPVRSVQNGIKVWLNLEHQLESVDYTKKNFVHADMSPEQFAKSMEDRGESFTELIFRMMGRGIVQQSKLQAEGRSSDIEFLSALFSKNRALRLKTLMAEQFEDMDSMLVGLGGPEGTTIIEGRNQAALDVLRKEIENGKKKIGIFYGAGHLIDMDKRLRDKFHLKPVSVRWLTAWDLREKR